MSKPSKIFALDIGTRKVMGILARSQDNEIQVIDSEVVEHPTRAMSAGQIQDVIKVAGVVRQVTEALSQRCGEPLTKVAVAVAGRNLKTILGRASLYCPKDRVLEPRDVERLTCDALEDALRRLSLESIENSRNSQFYCVGYAISRFVLDGEALLQPCGHRGERLEAEVLATFLPRQVLETQIVVLEAAGLEATSVTLEPIAALQAVVNQDMRQFHLAMVDVGAGTSDIAIVGQGLIESFGMVPCAGDSITEKISNEFLLDFNGAERVKRSLGQGGSIEALNIFHQPVRLNATDVLAAIQPAVRDLAYRIAKCILELTAGQTPQTVLCVGGGSLTPGLLEEVAHALRIHPSRVGTRSPGGVQGLTDTRGRQMGPETATPLGIACVASVDGGVRFKKITLNGNRMFLLEFGKPVTIVSALTTAGVAAKDIFGWPGRSKTFTVNGEFRIFKAKDVQPARVQLNGVKVDLNHPIMEGDRIEFQPAETLEDASGTVAEALGLTHQFVFVNGAPRAFHPRVSSHGRLVDVARPIDDRMALTIEPAVLRDILTPEELACAGIRLNGKLATAETELSSGDRVEAQAPMTVPGVPGATSEDSSASGAGRQPTVLRICLNGKWETLKDRDGRPVVAGRDSPMLVDALRHISIEPASVGKRLKLLLNGREAHFTSPLHDGADVQVLFE